MACGCLQSTPTFLLAGSGVAVTGTGTEQSPYRVSAATAEAALNFSNTNSLKLAKTGAGTAASPYQVAGDVQLDPQGALAVGNAGIGVVIDGAAGNILTLTSSGKLRAAGSAAVLVSDTGGITDTDTGLAVKLDPDSPLPITGSTAGLAVAAPPVDNSITDAITARINFLQQMARHQDLLVGGGTRQVNTAYVSWSTSLYAIGPRRAGVQTGSFYMIDRPANGTVIPGVGGAANATVPTSGTYAGMVPLADWQALVYLLPTTSSATASVAANFRIVSYTAAATLGDNAIIVAMRDGSADKGVTWGDAQKQLPWLSSANGLKYGTTAVSSMQQKFNYRVTDGVLELDYFGVVTATQNVSGLLSIESPIALPAYDQGRNYHNHVGTGRFFSSASGSKASWEYIIQPYIPNGGTAIYFLVAKQASQSNVGGVTANTTFNQSVPRIDEGPILTQSTELSFQMRFPIANAPT